MLLTDRNSLPRSFNARPNINILSQFRFAADIIHGNQLLLSRACNLSDPGHYAVPTPVFPSQDSGRPTYIFSCIHSAWDSLIVGAAVSNSWECCAPRFYWPSAKVPSLIPVPGQSSFEYLNVDYCTPIPFYARAHTCGNLKLQGAVDVDPLLGLGHKRANHERHRPLPPSSPPSALTINIVYSTRSSCFIAGSPTIERTPTSKSRLMGVTSTDPH